MTQPFQPPADLPPETPLSTDDDVKSAWAVIFDRRHQIQEISRLRCPQMDEKVREEIVGSALDLLVLSHESFAKVLDSWRQLDKEGVLQRLASNTGRVVL